LHPRDLIGKRNGFQANPLERIDWIRQHLQQRFRFRDFITREVRLLFVHQQKTRNSRSLLMRQQGSSSNRQVTRSIPQQSNLFAQKSSLISHSASMEHLTPC
jgi:hypothetical protein